MNKKDTTKAKSKIRQLSDLDVSEFLVKRNIKDTKESQKKEQEQEEQERKTEGNKDFDNYILSRSSKKLDELLKNTWRMEEAAEVLNKAKPQEWKFYLRMQKNIVLNYIWGSGSSVPMKLLLTTKFALMFLLQPCQT